jgi:membrane fusion protein (multidrug efflux system)
MSKKSLIIPLVVLLAAAGLLFRLAGHLTEWQGNQPDQKTDDAHLIADMTPLSTLISGSIRKVNVNDYQSVKAGQTLIERDDEDYQATLNQAQAALAASEASLADNRAAKRKQAAQIDAAKARILQPEAAINVAKAGIASASPELDRAL